MATRLDELSERDFPWYVRLVFAYQKRKYRQVLSPMWAWGRQPAIMFVFLILIGRFKRLASPGPLLRTLMSVRISQINHCAFCVDFNAHNFLAAHGAHEKIDCIDRWQEHPEVFSEEERAALAYAEAVTLNDDAGVARAMTEPHLVEKARMAMNGTLTRPIDLFDVVWHLLPTALLVWKTVLWRRERAAVKEPSPIDSSG